VTDRPHSPADSDRTRIRRIPENAVHDRATLDAVLDAGLVAHVSVVSGEQPFVLPVAYARRDDEVLFHGSSGSRLFRTLAEGQPTCLTVTLLDGLVLARSAFHSSMHYRSAMVLGVARRLTGEDELDGLRVVTEHLLPGRWDDCRQPTAKERAATILLSLPLEEWSLKIGTGDPQDDEEDITDAPYSGIWAGSVPIRESFGTPARSADCPPEIPLPEYVQRWRR